MVKHIVILHPEGRRGQGRRRENHRLSAGAWWDRSPGLESWKSAGPIRAAWTTACTPSSTAGRPWPIMPPTPAPGGQEHFWTWLDKRVCADYDC